MGKVLMGKAVLWLVAAGLIEVALLAFAIVYAIFVSPLSLLGAAVPVIVVGLIIFYLIREVRYQRKRRNQVSVPLDRKQ